MSEGQILRKLPPHVEIFFLRAHYFLLFTGINISHTDSYQAKYSRVEVCGTNALLLPLFTPWCYK